MLKERRSFTGIGEAGHPGLRGPAPLEGYRRPTFMMLGADLVAVSPSSVYRVRAEPILAGRNAKLAAAREARKAKRQRERTPA